MPIEEITTKRIVCKNCGSEVVVKFSSYKGVPRYWCIVCKRRFREGDYDVFNMKVPAEYVNRAVGEYYAGLSINLLKQDYGYYPSKSVIFQLVEKNTNLNSKQLKDYHTQVDDTWIADETRLDMDGQHKVWFY
jgi:DNA-directed RNA polymerase subunit RPC12/RpoP